jgi:AcrR family transcriptional regulator
MGGTQVGPVADTRERIISAAESLFAERGYTATTTRAIAERAGVNEVTLFRHFDSKLGILRSITDRFAERSAARAVHALPGPEDTRATLLALARNEIEVSLESGGVALRLAFDAPSVPEIAELMGEGPGANLQALADYMTLRQAAGDLRGDIDAMTLAEAFATMTSSFVMYRMVMGLSSTLDEVTTEEKIGQLFDVFWSGAASGGPCDE